MRITLESKSFCCTIYKIDKRGEKFWISDPAKGKYRLARNEFVKHWLSTKSDETDKGLAMFFQKTSAFDNIKITDFEKKRSLRFLWAYILQYKSLFLQIVLGLLLGCLLQLIMPFLTHRPGILPLMMGT